VLQNVRLQSAGKGERVGTVMDLYIGVMPFMVVMLVLVALLVAFPAIATWLPATMRR
jgi:C4-dicarboxylate transporter, DctM subunit